jgi:hypothetical protein
MNMLIMKINEPKDLNFTSRSEKDKIGLKPVDLKPGDFGG